MAKNKKEKKEGGSKVAGVLIAILLIITWLSVMALLIKCDVGGFGSDVLRPVFKDVPVINVILPDASDEEVAKESDIGIDNLGDALSEIERLNAAVGSKDAEITSLSDQVAELEAEVARLSAIESDLKEFETEKKEFYDEIVYGESAPDADTYIEWYNQLDSEYAEKIYREMLAKNEASQEILELAKAYESMDAKNAADILSSMKNDMDTVALIMNNMSTKAQGDILAAMDADFAANVTKKLLP